jgi:hypothetical protein
MHYEELKQKKKTNKFHGLSPRANYKTERPPLVGDYEELHNLKSKAIPVTGGGGL